MISKDYRPVLDTEYYLFVKRNNHIISIDKDLLSKYYDHEVNYEELTFNDEGYKFLTKGYPYYLTLDTIEEVENILIGDYIFYTVLLENDIVPFDCFIFYKEIEEQDKTVLSLLNIDYE